MGITLIGTGLMGEPLAQRLMQAGHVVTVYNRTPEKTHPLAKEGATIASSPAEAIQSGDWVLTAVADAVALRQTLLSTEARTALRHRKVLNLATIGPHEARALQEEIKKADGEFMECPVLGSRPEARDGTLILMFGGSEVQFQAAQPLLTTLGPKPLYIGEVGKAAALKLAMNQLIAGLTVSFAWSLSLVRKEEIDCEQLMEILRDSALYAPTFDKKLGRMLEGNYTSPNFSVTHLLKDVRLLEVTGARHGLDTSLIQTLVHILERVEDQGEGDSDYSALYKGIDPGKG